MEGEALSCDLDNVQTINFSKIMTYSASIKKKSYLWNVVKIMKVRKKD